MLNGSNQESGRVVWSSSLTVESEGPFLTWFDIYEA